MTFSKNYCSKTLASYSLMLFILMNLALSCSPARKFQKSKEKEYQSLVRNSAVFNRGFTGFLLYDPVAEKALFSINSDKHFTPASNTKIFTLFTAMNVLGDSVPALRYVTNGDSMIFWGTGDPSFLHPRLVQNERVIQFLKTRKEQLFYCPHNFMDERFGPGWAWDDFPYSYQPESAAFPFHGNVVHFEKSRFQDSFDIKPAFFKTEISANEKLEPLRIKRRSDCNIFEYHPLLLTLPEYQSEHPFKYSDELLMALLSETLGKKVELLRMDSMPPAGANVIYSVSADTLYRRMMQESDNFIAGQLLLLCADALFDTLNASKVIRFAKDSLMADIPGETSWVDGSGLSRYNLFTPEAIVFVLNRLYKNISRERLLHIFPAGCVSGTITKYYAGEGRPYVFAKTGTLRNNHCLSGFLLTKSGKTLIFSFMHNNFPGNSNSHKAEMERVLKAIHLAY